MNLRLIAACALALGLPACQSLTPQQAVRLGFDLYCVAITEEGKQAVRDALTHGVKVIEACPPGAIRATAEGQVAENAPSDSEAR